MYNEANRISVNLCKIESVANNYTFFQGKEFIIVSRSALNSRPHIKIEIFNRKHLIEVIDVFHYILTHC